MDNLPELRDIHLPTDTVSIFPLAYGWWLLILLIFGVWLLYKVLVYIRLTSAKLYANYLLKDLAGRTDIAAAAKMSEILRRVCLKRYSEAVALSDTEWIDFLNNKSKYKLAAQSAELLKNAPYIQQDSTLYSASDVADLYNFCKVWIGENL